MNNEELVKQIRDGQSVQSNMAALWKQNTGMIFQTVRKYREYAEMDDLMQEAYFGLVEAVKHYDLDAEAKFITYMPHWIRQKISRYIKSNSVVRVPEHMRHQISEYNKAYRDFMQDHARTPTGAEMSRITGLSYKDIKHLKKTARILNTGSMDAPVGEDESMRLYDIVPSGEPDTDEKDSVLNKVQNEELAAVLWGMVDALPEGQACALTEYYKNNRTLKEIGEMRGCSLNWANQLKNEGLKALRNPKRSRILKSFTDDWYYGKGLSGNGVGSFNRSWTSSTERIAINKLEKEEEQKLREQHLEYCRILWGEDFDKERDIIDSIVDRAVQERKPVPKLG